MCLFPKGKSTTNLVGSPFSRGKVTIFIGRETKTEILSTKSTKTFLGPRTIIILLEEFTTQQQQSSDLERLRFNRRGASTPLWGVDSWSHQKVAQLPRPRSSGHNISMEHRLRRKHLQLNSETNASNEKFFFKKKMQEKRTRTDTFSQKKQKMEQMKKEMKKHESEVILKWAIPTPLLLPPPLVAQKSNFTKENCHFLQ